MSVFQASLFLSGIYCGSFVSRGGRGSETRNVHGIHCSKTFIVIINLGHSYLNG